MDLDSNQHVVAVSFARIGRFAVPVPADSLPLWGIPALVVEPHEADRALLVSTLTSAGLIVTAVDGFASARARLVRWRPTVLITEIRLGYHNGLHLAHIARWMRRQMILIVTSCYSDPVLTRDAEALGAAFIQKPFTPAVLLATLHRVAAPARYADDVMTVRLRPNTDWPPRAPDR